MDSQALQALLAERLPDCEVLVDSDGYYYNLTVIGDVFAGLSPVKRQQFVYGALKQEIADGTIHAVNMKTYTPEQWQARQN